MTNKQTFTDDLTKALPFISLCSAIGLTAVFLIAGLFAEGGISKNYVLVVLVISVGGTLIIMLIAWLFFRLMTTRRVSCDQAACEVATVGRGKVYDIKRFSWSEITDTNIARQMHGLGEDEWKSIHFFAIVSGAEIELMRKQNLTKDFYALVITVNQMTPHLPYVWVAQKEINNRRVLESIDRYYKVSRSDTFIKAT